MKRADLDTGRGPCASQTLLTPFHGHLHAGCKYIPEHRVERCTASSTSESAPLEIISLKARASVFLLSPVAANHYPVLPAVVCCVCSSHQFGHILIATM